MVNRNLIRSLEPPQQELEQALQEAFTGNSPEEIYFASGEFTANRIVRGKIVRVEPDLVLVDVGYKSEGVVLRGEWSETEPPPEPGQWIDVLIEDVEELGGVADDIRGMITLSKRKAEKIQAWTRIMQRVQEGDVVTGLVTRKIKGGLLVDIGVHVFLPASQVDVRRPGDIGEYLNRVVQCIVLKIDEARRNIVVSRRALIEQQRTEKKAQLLRELQIGQLRKGTVKNIADFGAFVDLGGIDGLLHITDMSWGRINHPSEIVSIDQEIEVVVLHIDYEQEKVALGLKQKTPSPWADIEDRYPIGSKVRGTVVKITNFGAFVRLEEGVEGLVHISEMSWTKRINHPGEVLQEGDEVEVVVLGINKEKQEISLGIKQTQENPWNRIDEKYPVGSDVKGVIRHLANFGAFIELEQGVDGLLHITDISWTRKINHPGEVLQKGQEVECRVLAIDRERRRISLGLKQRTPNPWETDIPQRYQPGQIVTGTVTKITHFGAFVNLEDGLEGLLHISELADRKVDDPAELVQVGQQIEVKVLRVEPGEQKIALSRKRLHWTEEQEQPTPPAPEPAGELKGGVGSASGGVLIPPGRGPRRRKPLGPGGPPMGPRRPPRDRTRPDHQQQPTAAGGESSGEAPPVDAEFSAQAETTQSGSATVSGYQSGYHEESDSGSPPPSGGSPDEARAPLEDRPAADASEAGHTD